MLRELQNRRRKRKLKRKLRRPEVSGVHSELSRVCFNVCLVEKSEHDHCHGTASCLTCIIGLIVPDLHLCSLGTERDLGWGKQHSSRAYRQTAVGR